MSPRTVRVVLMVICAVGIMTGCVSQFIYSGTGHLYDHGPLDGVDRYVIDLGPIDLRNIGESRLRLSNLPREEFIIGFDITFEDPPRFDKLTRGGLLTAVVALELRASDDSLIFTETVPLSHAAWSQWGTTPKEAFAYGMRRTTQFAPSSWTAYTLVVRVVEPDRSLVAYQATLAAKGGGWKGRD